MIKDALFTFSYRQVLDAVSNSQRSVDLQTMADYGVGRPWWVVVQACGTFTKDLRIQIIGSEDKEFSTVVHIADSGVIPKASLVQGYEYKIQVPQVDRKYRFIALRYIPSETGTPSKGDETPSGSEYTLDGVFDPVEVAGKVPEPLADGVTAFASINVATELDYPHANADKITA